MSASLLREAAARLRDEWIDLDPGVRPTAFYLAVADWLDGMAARAESKIKHGGDSTAVWSHEIHALTVARAYLGRSS